ncbi:MAG: MarR family transcriptional regulator [Planctomycetota bacterium]
MKRAEDIHLGRWVGMLYRRRDIYFDHQLQPYGIGPGQYRILRILYHRLTAHNEAALNQQAIAREVNLDKAAVTRSLKKLETQGFIRRHRSAEDGREFCVELTPKARRLEDTMWKIRHRWSEILGKGLTLQEQKTASELMARMAANTDEFLNAQRKCP